MSAVYCGNALSVLDTFESETFSTIVTSPRYNVGKDYGPGINDKTNREDYLLEMYTAGEKLLHVASKDCLFFLNVGDNAEWPSRAFDVCSVFRASGWNLTQTIIWAKSLNGKGHFTQTQGVKHLTNMFEYIFILAKDPNSYTLDRLAIGVPYTDPSNTKRFKHGSELRCQGNLWHITYKTVNAKSKKLHSAPFPVELPCRCIKLNGCKGPVLDPFAGSFTTAVAAMQLGLEFTMIELDPASIELGMSRLTGSEIIGSKEAC